TNTLLKPRDYEYILRDGRAEVAIVSGALAPALAEARPRAPALKHIVVAGRASAGALAYDDLVSAESSELAPAETTKRSEEHTSELQSLRHLVCRLLLEKKKTHK